MKKGSYVYLTHNRHPLAVKFENIKNLPYKKGVFIRHFGYDLSKYRSGRGQGSLYLLLQKSLFNPPLPFYFMNKVDSYGNRTIKGSRAAFLGGLDPEDKDSKLEIIYSDSISEKKISGGNDQLRLSIGLLKMLDLNLIKRQVKEIIQLTTLKSYSKI